MRWSWSALMPFLLAPIRCIANSHLDSGILLRSMTVPTVTVNWPLHSAQVVQARPVRLTLTLGDLPLIGVATVRTERTIGPADRLKGFAGLVVVMKRGVLNVGGSHGHSLRMLVECSMALSVIKYVIAPQGPVPAFAISSRIAAVATLTRVTRPRRSITASLWSAKS